MMPSDEDEGPGVMMKGRVTKGRRNNDSECHPLIFGLWITN